MGGWQKAISAFASWTGPNESPVYAGNKSANFEVRFLERAREKTYPRIVSNDFGILNDFYVDFGILNDLGNDVGILFLFHSGKGEGFYPFRKSIDMRIQILR